MEGTTPKRPALPAPQPRPQDKDTLLAGLRVVDFSHFIAGPFATMMLADFGADVVKIEDADTGDGFRAYPPHLGTEGVPYLWTNRNKRSVALDLKTPQGVELALRLADTADIVVENFSTGVMARLGLDYDTISARNPRVIFCSVSSFGRSGPSATRIGFDPVVQAESGFMSMTGRPDQEPMRAGPSIMDLSTAMMSCNAILAAVVARQRTGRGQYIETTMIETAINMLGNFSMAYLATGVSPTRFGNIQTTACPVGTFAMADGSIYLACANDRTYRRFVTDVIGRPDLADDPRYATSAARRQNQPALIALIAEALAPLPRGPLLEKTQAAGVPAGAVHSVGEALDAAVAFGMVSEIPHPTIGSIPNVGLPMHFSDTPVVDPVSAPLLGQHTDEVLSQILGLDADALRAYAATGALGTKRRGG